MLFRPIRFLVIVACLWGQVCQGEDSSPSADVDDNGVVNGRDLLQVVAQWHRNTDYPGGGELPPGVTRYPYIQKTTDRSFLVAWRTEEQVAGSVEYGTSESLGSSVFIPDATMVHAITVSDLVADATYYYRVTGDGVPLTPIERTQTFPVLGTDQPFSFAVLGDSGDGSHYQLKVAYQLDQLPVDFVVHTGDVVYLLGEAKYYEDRFFLPYMNTLKRIPVFPCLGNHDKMTGLGAPYLENFYLPENSPEEPERYYSFDFGDAHFTVLEGGNQAGDYLPSLSEYEWLVGDLSAAAGSRWRFVVFHYAPYNSEILHYADPFLPNLREYWVPLFEAYGVHVVFTGHCHYYERSIPLSGGNPDPADGVMYVISGGGGGLVREGIGFDQCPECLLRSAYRASRHHLLKVEVDGFRLTVNAIDEHGEVFDRLYLMQNEDRSTKWVLHF